VAGAAVVFQGCQTLPGTSSTENEIHLALLSDTHIGGDRERAKDPKGGFDPWENFHRIVPDILARPPRGVILNGDAASREGLPEDYRDLKALLEPLSRVTPVYIGLGNHDHPIEQLCWLIVIASEEPTASQEALLALRGQMKPADLVKARRRAAAIISAKPKSNCLCSRATPYPVQP
jgi:metallophosphoesterase superfamily enzyme